MATVVLATNCSKPSFESEAWRVQDRVGRLCSTLGMVWQAGLVPPPTSTGLSVQESQMHCSNELRDCFCDELEAFMRQTGSKRRLRAAARNVLGCSDTLPSDYCAFVEEFADEDEFFGTYEQAAAIIMKRVH